MGVPLWVRGLRGMGRALWWAGDQGIWGGADIVDEGMWLKWDMEPRGQGAPSQTQGLCEQGDLQGKSQGP